MYQKLPVAKLVSSRQFTACHEREDASEDLSWEFDVRFIF